MLQFRIFYPFLQKDFYVVRVASCYLSNAFPRVVCPRSAGGNKLNPLAYHVQFFYCPVHTFVFVATPPPSRETPHLQTARGRVDNTMRAQIYKLFVLSYPMESFFNISVCPFHSAFNLCVCVRVGSNDRHQVHTFLSGYFHKTIVYVVVK